MFGGDKPDGETADSEESRPIEQRNSLHYLCSDHGSLSWTGPLASADPYPNLSNLPNGAIPRSEHVWVPAGNPDFLMAQGGCYFARGVSYLDQGGLADWIAFDTQSNRWTQLRPPAEHESNLPVMTGHAAVSDPISGRVLLFMAFAEEVELPELDPDEGLPGFALDTRGDPSHWKHRPLETTGDAPSLRAGYTVTVLGRQMFLFGGFYEVFRKRKWHVNYPEEVFALDLDELHWSRLHTTGDTPGGRMEHGAVALDDRRLLIVGGEHGFGRSAQRLNDAYVLDVEKARWERLTTSLKAPRHATWVGFGQPGNVRVFSLGGAAEGFPVFEFVPNRSV